MTLFRMVAPQNVISCRYYLKIVAKTVAKHSHQNQAIDDEIINDQYMVHSLHVGRGIFPKEFM